MKTIVENKVTLLEVLQGMSPDTEEHIAFMARGWSRHGR